MAAYGSNWTPNCGTKDVFIPVLQTHYVISEGQTELETKQTAPQSTTQGQVEHLEQQPANQQATTQYIITTTTNGSGTSEVHITKPWTVPTTVWSSMYTSAARMLINEHAHGYMQR